MRSLSQALKDAFAREDLAVCRCVEIVLPNGASDVHLTDLTAPMWFQGDYYEVDPAIDVSAIRTSQDTNAQNCEIQLTYAEEGRLSERAIRFGSLNNATVRIWWVDYRSPEIGGVEVLTGTVQDVEQPGSGYCILNVSSQNVGNKSTLVAEAYSKRCRNIFGDKRCKVDIDALSTPFTVVRVYPNLAQFAINGYVNQETPRPEDPPRANGELLKPTYEGEFDLVVPKAQVLKIKMRSSGGGGATSGGQNYTFNNNKTISAGYPGNPAFNANLTRAGQKIFDLTGGGGGSRFPGYDQRTNPITSFVLYDKPPKGNPGIVLPSLVTPDLYSATGGKGGEGSSSGGDTLFSNGSRGSREGQGGDGGEGAYIEHTFYLEDPACPIKWGDTLRFSIGSPGDSPDDGPTPSDPFSEEARYDTMPGQRGALGGFEVVWTSNTGEELLPQTFSLGSVLWLTGDNAGSIIQIADNTAGIISLTNNPRQPINPGDTGLLRPGCSNYADMCENRWDNLRNMQAEPVTPQGATSAPTPISDTSVDVTKPAPVTSTGDFGFLGHGSGGV